jgi:hypothetical protein
MAVGKERAVARGEPRQDRKVEAPSDEAQDRSTVVLGVIDVAFLGKGRDDQGGNP